MTLSEMAAAAKKGPGQAPVGAGGGLRLNARENAGSKSAKESPAAGPAIPPSPRPLGAECCGECLPMDWPQTDPEAAWEEARHGTPAETAIVLSECGKWAWLCLLPSPNHPQKPLLLKRWPVAGKLTKEAGGLAVVDPDDRCPMCFGLKFILRSGQVKPCPNCGGSHSGLASCPTSQPATVPSAGCDGAGLYHPEVVSASMPD